MSNDQEELKKSIEEKVIRHVIELEENNKKQSSTILSKNDELALQQFDDEKTSILKEAQRLGVGLSDDDITTPYDIEHYQGYLEAYSDLIEPENKHTQTPKGKVNFSHQYNIEINNEDDWRTRPFNSTEHMIDFLVSRKELGEIESSKNKPNLQLVSDGQRASEMLEELWTTAIESGKTISAGRKLVYEEDPSKFREKGAYVKDPRKLRLMR